MQGPENATERLNDHVDPDLYDPYYWRRKGSRYTVHQNVRERLRRFKQIAAGKLTAAFITPDAREVAECIRFGVAVESAEQACRDYLDDARGDYRDHIQGRLKLLSAVRDLARWVRGEPDTQTATTSAVLLDSSVVVGNSDNNLLAAELADRV